MPKPKIDLNIRKIIKKNQQGIKLDIGSGDNKNEGFVGIDILPFNGVDIVHDLEKFPWPLPDECTSLAVASHLLEHINPGRSDPRLAGLGELLLKKKVIGPKEVDKFIGEPNPGAIFLRFMDEVWRILKPGGQFMFVVPYAGSKGFFWDPTHVNPINEMTLEYFDPLGPKTGGSFYKFYQPKPWKILPNSVYWDQSGNLEVSLEKRAFKKDGRYSNG